MIEFSPLIESSKSVFFETLFNEESLQKELEKKVDPNDILLKINSYGTLYYHVEYDAPLEFVRFTIYCESNIVEGYFIAYFRDQKLIDIILNWSIK